MLVNKLALEISEQNFATKSNHAPYMDWGLYYLSMPNKVTPSSVPGGAIGQSLKESVL